MSKFIHYPDRPKKLTAEFAKKEYQKLLERLPDAEGSTKPDLWLKLFADWNSLKSYVGSEAARINHSFNKNMSDRNLESADKYLREKVAPVADQPEYLLTRAFLDSRHRQALTKKYGDQLVPDFEISLKPLDPINTKLRIELGQLSKRYGKKIATAKVTVRGKRVTLWQIRSFTTSDDPSLRKEAWLAAGDWSLHNRRQFADIYKEQVLLRDQMSKNVGFRSYVPFAYENMGRTDYDVKQVKKFRECILKYVVPLRLKLINKQASALKKPSLKPWDSGYNPSLTLPLGIVPIAEQLDNAQRLFNDLSPILGKHFRTMLKEGLIDLENRENKYSGAYCTSFSDEGKVAILCNSTGDEDDIQTLTHEMGHAFQGWESQHIESVDLQWGTADLAEICSTGMEFLSLARIEEFFSERDAEKFRESRWDRSINLLCYVCVVDEFQHWVYENINATDEQRDKAWCQIADIYIPGIDWEGYEKYRKTRWYSQGHIFNSPFYYIDYALAETVAMQLAMLAEADHAKAMRSYLDLCRLGGTKSFLSTVKHAGLRSPFDEKLVAELTAHAEKVLL